MTFKRRGSRSAPDVTMHGRQHRHIDGSGCRRDDVAGKSICLQPSAPRLRIGDHLVSARRFISHHGIYVGNGQVIHYGGLASGLQAGPVKVSPLVGFLADHPYKLREYKTRTYSREESVEMARARIGEDLYHRLSITASTS